MQVQSPVSQQPIKNQSVNPQMVQKDPIENKFGLKKQYSDLQIKPVNVESNTSAKMTNFSNKVLSPINSQMPFMNESDMQTLNARNYEA